MKKVVRLVFLVAVAAFAGLVAWKNEEVTHFKVPFWDEFPVYSGVVALASFAVGIVVAFLYMLPKWLGAYFRTRKLEKEIALLLEEKHSLERRLSTESEDSGVPRSLSPQSSSTNPNTTPPVL